MLTEIATRLRLYWIALRRPESQFRYDSRSGYGLAMERYNPLTDRVYVRVSKFGYVEHHGWRSRRDFFTFGSLYSARSSQTSS